MSSQKKVFLTPGTLKYKLRVAFCLMSILPLLVSVYLVSSYILPRAGFKLDLTVMLSLSISLFIAIIGFFVVKEVFDRVLSISSEAKLIAAGDLDHVVHAGKEDEIGYLGDALNQLTLQIRSNMDELKNYGERTTEINVEIQKRVLVLSSLLQISSLISQGLKLEETLELAVQKSRILANSDVAFLFLREKDEGPFSSKAVDGENAKYLSKLEIEPQEAVFKDLVRNNKPLVVDKDNPISDSARLAFYEKYRLRNIFALPIFLKGSVMGILGIANNREIFKYQKNDMELLDIFAKQVGIAIENDLLVRWVEQLEIKDSLTGLYNTKFIVGRLNEEIKRAVVYQRPCALILLDIDNFQKIHQSFGELQTEATLKNVATLIKESVSEIDRVARTGDNEFAVVLPEKNKRQAQNIAEEIRKKIELTFSKEADANRRLTVSGGVTENPLDGVTSDELFNKARELAGMAKTKGKNRIL